MKKWWIALAALLAALWAALKGRSPWQGRAEDAQAEALEASKEVNQLEADKAHADIDAMSDDDIIADAIKHESARRSGGD